MTYEEVLNDLEECGRLMITVKYATCKVETAYNYLSPDNADHNALIDASGIHGHNNQISVFDAGKKSVTEKSVTVLVGSYEANITAFVMIHIYDKVYRFYVKSKKDVERLINRIKYQGHIHSEIDRIAEWLLSSANVHVLTIGCFND